MATENNNSNYSKISKKKIIRVLIMIAASLAVSFLLILFTLIWQDSYTMIAYCNSFFFAGAILFVIGWMVLMFNLNVLSPLIYGTKSFFLMFIAKKPKLNYYDYMESIKKNPIAKVYILVPMLASIPNIITAIILAVQL